MSIYLSRFLVSASIFGAAALTFLPLKCSAQMGEAFGINATRNLNSPNQEWDDVGWTDMPSLRWEVWFAASPNDEVPANPSGLGDEQKLSIGSGSAGFISASFWAKHLMDLYIRPKYESGAPYAYHNIGFRASTGQKKDSYSNFMYYSWTP